MTWNSDGDDDDAIEDAIAWWPDEDGELDESDDDDIDSGEDDDADADEDTDEPLDEDDNDGR